MRANACKGGGGVLDLRAHAFWPLKTLNFWAVLMEEIDHLKSRLTRGHYRITIGTIFTFATYAMKVYQKLLFCCWFYLAIQIHPLVVQVRQGSFGLKSR